MSINETAIQRGIAADAAYVGNLVRDLSNPKHASFMGTISLCMAPYLSLFVHESYRKLESSDPALASSLSSHVKAIVARSRHSLKLFEDTHRGIDGQIAFFRDEILPAHAQYFLGNTWFPPARFLETDLGLFSYDGRLVTTSHAATFHMGIEPQEILGLTGPEMQSVYAEYGQYFSLLGARLDVNGRTFVSYLDPRRFSRPGPQSDVRADKYYRRVFDGPNSLELNALLTVFRCMLNFVGPVIIADGDKNAENYTVFKIRYLTLYQVLSSLHVLKTERQQRQLGGRSTGFIERIVDTSEAQLIMEPSAKPFRNTLMHYNLHSQVNAASIDISQPLFGLVPIYFSSYNADAFSELVDRCISETASVMEEWAG
jgi:hypothetical protein